MTPLRILALAVPCGWLLAALGFILLIELEDTTVAFEVPHLQAHLRIVR